MELRPDREDLTILLYESAMRGCVTTLNTLIQKDRLILNKVSLTPFTETPLHISALLGHLDFTIAILERCPKMVSEYDSFKRLPLHLASAEGHIEIIKALLCYDKDNICLLASDQDGRIPLHFAAMRGRVEAIQELVNASSESILELLDGDTVLHLCVKYNHLDALKLLVTLINDNDQLVNLGNLDGNTILHLAAIKNQSETIRYLLSLPEVKERTNAINGTGLTALDMIEQCPTDFKSLQIRDNLMKAGGKRAVELSNNNNNNLPPQPQAISSNKKFKSKPKKSRFEKCMKHLQYNVEDIRGSLMIVATVIATMTFQAAMNPPGGVWQQDFKDFSGGHACSETNICEAGTAVLAYAYPQAYIYYLTYTSIAFAASLGVIASIVGGFPLRNKFCVWLLAQAIGSTLFFLAVSYIFGMLIVSPSRYRVKMANMDFKIIYVLIGVFLVAGLIESIRFLVWTIKKLRKFGRR